MSSIKKETRNIEIGGPKVTLISEKKEKHEVKEKIKDTIVKEKEENIITIDSSDSNVKAAWKNKDWIPQTSQQKEPHTINFATDNIDRIEMKHSFSTALNLEEDLIEEWWLDTTQKKDEVIGLLSNKQSEQPYRVTIKWVSNKGWQPILVEELINLY